MLNEGDEDYMEAVLEKKQNPLFEAKKLLQKAMQENRRTPKDVKEGIGIKRYND